MVKLEEIGDDDYSAVNMNHLSIYVQCKNCYQTFGYFANFLDVGLYQGTNYFMIMRDNLDWDINIIEDLSNIWCKCGVHIGIQWDEKHILIKKSSIKLHY